MNDDEELPFSASNADEVFKKDAEMFQNKIRQQFIDFRQTFGDVVNQVRSQHFDTFVKLGLDPKLPKESVEDQKERENQLIKERIQNLGGKKMVNNLFKEAVPEASDEEKDDRSKSSQSNPDEEDFYSNSSDQEHQPRVGGGLPAGFGGGIPKPRKFELAT